MVRVCVIGCGNMGGALVRGLAATGECHVTVCDVDPSTFESIAGLDVETSTDPAVATAADVVFLAVKPDLVPPVIEDLDLTAEQTIVSIAAGVPTEVVAARTDARVVRMMPNLAANWGEMAAAVTGEPLPPEVRTILERVGVVVDLEEDRMDVATAVNGSGPAFVFYFIQAMAQAGVERGLDPDDARLLAAQTFKGAAETVLNADESIDELIDAVCSPQGTTIEGMGVLRASDVHATIVDAVVAAEQRAAELAAEAHHE